MAKSCSKSLAAPSNENAPHLCQWLLGSNHWNDLTGILEDLVVVVATSIRKTCVFLNPLQVVGGSAVQAAVQFAPEFYFVCTIKVPGSPE